MIIVDQEHIRKIIQKRKPDATKWSHGRALIFAGSKAKIGAAIIATKACLRAGAGLVTVNIPRKERLAIFTTIPEAMIEFREEKTNWDTYTVFAVGPGFGIDKSAERKIELLVDNVKTPCVFDADALTIFSKNQQLLNKLPKKSILTPHSKEFDRVFGDHSSEDERRQTAIKKAKELKIILVLKGHKTFITDGVHNYENTTGNSGLAKGGSGDALTGIITALLAQEYESLNAAILGVYIHGLAADITLETQSVESMLITDVIKNLGKAFHKIQQ
jgi:NAD(P)H-hydrate epimerase